MMNRQEKISWRLSVVYILFLFINSLKHIFSQHFETFFFSFLFQVLLLGLFYLAFKRKKLLFSALSFSCLLWGTTKAITVMHHLVMNDQNNATPVVVGAILGLIFTLLTTYFVLRAFLAQMMQRNANGSR